MIARESVLGDYDMINRKIAFSPNTRPIPCDQEYIRKPGLIQPYGMLLVISKQDFTILQVSHNTQDFLFVPPTELINQNLDFLLDAQQIQKLRQSLVLEDLDTINPLRLVININQQTLIFDSIIHASEELLLLEIEPVVHQEQISFLEFYHLVRSSVLKLQGATGFKELCDFLAQEVRRISGFDRVMVYQFDHLNNGSVIAEDKQADLEPFLGLHYPATDIPAQARELYKSTWTRLIADVEYAPVEIMPQNNPLTQEPLDLSQAILRAVSPIHIEYLQNMGVRATLCISLMQHGKLWGLIACHHYSRRYIPYNIRKACEFLGQVMSVELIYKEKQEKSFFYKDKLRIVLDNLLQTNPQEQNFANSLIKNQQVLLDLVKATGAVVSLGNNFLFLGKTPPQEFIYALMGWLETNYQEEIFHTNHLAKLYPEAIDYKDEASGVLAISIARSQKSYQVIWFRPEVIQTVNWAGNPRQSLEVDTLNHQRLSPRNSFALWKETVKFQSLPWDSGEIEAALELRSALMLAALESSQYQLRQSQELAQVTLQSIADGVITVDHLGYVQSCNPVAEQITGWSEVEARGLQLSEVFHLTTTNLSTLNPSPEEIQNPTQKAFQEGCIVSLANYAILVDRTQKEWIISHSAAPIRNRNNEIIGAVLVFRDVTEEQKLAGQLSWQATHDNLTGLVNRREFESRLEKEIAFAKSSGLESALCYLDLDQFKIVNDTCGHLAGDELLRQVSNLLDHRLRQTDTLARLGGDEFGILLHQSSLAAAQQVAISLQKQLQQFRFVWEDKTFQVGVSIGLVAINAETPDLTSALSAVDAACYAAKNQGRNRIHIYQADDQELIKQRGEMRWAVQIPQALAENRFCLYYQTIVPVNQSASNFGNSNSNLNGFGDSGDLSNFDDFSKNAPSESSQIYSNNHGEILLRLRDASGQLIAPTSFISAAERYDLMSQIDRWVIQKVFSHLQEQEALKNSLRNPLRNPLRNYGQHPPHNHSPLYAINLSGASINDEQFVDFLYEQLELYQVSPQLICFEITETLAITNLKTAMNLIHSLKALGCSFALDDFGSGMSSFTYLKNLPVDYLKIDGAFVREIGEDAIAYEIVEAIHRVGKVMGMKTIAEFVESPLIFKKLQQIGVDYAQGYAIGKPRPFIL